MFVLHTLSCLAVKARPQRASDLRFCIVTMGARDAFPIPVILLSMVYLPELDLKQAQLGVHQGLLVLFTQPFVFGGKRAPLDFRFCIVTMGARDAFPIPVILLSMMKVTPTAWHASL